MDIEAIYNKFIGGEIDEDTPYAEELREMLEAFQNQLIGPGCAACRRRAVEKNFKHRFIDVMQKYKN